MSNVDFTVESVFSTPLPSKKPNGAPTPIRRTRDQDNDRYFVRVRKHGQWNVLTSKPTEAEAVAVGRRYVETTPWCEAVEVVHSIQISRSVFYAVMPNTGQGA